MGTCCYVSSDRKYDCLRNIKIQDFCKKFFCCINGCSNCCHDNSVQKNSEERAFPVIIVLDEEGYNGELLYIKDEQSLQQLVSNKKNIKKLVRKRLSYTDLLKSQE